MNKNFSAKDAGTKEWKAAEKGFWRGEPYLVLTKSMFYMEQQVTLNQHVVIDANEEVDIYRFWIHTFSHEDLESLLASHNFRVTKCYDRLISGCDMYRSEDVTFCIAFK